MALVAYYKFDGNKNDSSGNGYDLSGPIYSYSNDSFTGGKSIYVNPFIGGLSVATPLLFTGCCSVTMWIKILKFPTTILPLLFNLTSSQAVYMGVPGYYVYLNAGLRLRPQKQLFHRNVSNILFPVNKWVNVYFHGDLSSYPGTCNYGINGIGSGSDSLFNNQDTTNFGNNIQLFPTNPNGGAEFLINEVKIYNDCTTDNIDINKGVIFDNSGNVEIVPNSVYFI